MIRAFAAISIPESILDGIEQTTARLRKLGLDAKYTKRSAIHLTLKFIGNIEEVLVEDISDALERSTRPGMRFSLVVKGVGVFPDFRKPRIIWAGIEAQPLLTDLQRRVDSNLALLGFEPEKRVFSPHLTLARLKAARNVADLRRFVEEEGEDLSFGCFQVDEIHLYQSLLRPEGAEYRRLITHPLPSLS